MNPHRDQSSAISIPISFEIGPDASGVVTAAFAAARSAQLNWSRTSLRERLRRLRVLRSLIAEHGRELAESSAQSRRRPLQEVLVAEVVPLAEACRFLEKNASRILASRQCGARGRPVWLGGVTAEVRREPWGVVLVIGPGNYPLLLPGVQTIQALVAGNAVVLKPGVGGLGAAQGLQRLIERAGLDSRLVQVLPESTDAARLALAARPNKVVFTGSAEVGEKVLFQLAPQLTPATMELSGCDAMIVRADADLALVVKALKFGLTLNDGATCLAPKRIFVSAACATELEGRLAEALRPATTIRPLTETLKAVVQDLQSRGAHFIAGGVTGTQMIRLPAIVGGVPPMARVLHEDVFAPFAALVTVTDDHEAVLRTNDCPYGLGVSIFSRDETAARALAERVQAGVVTINDLLLPTADARLPFGGRGRSGFGSTRGAEGLLELTVPKVVTVSRSKFRFAFEPPQRDDAALFEAYLMATHRQEMGRRLKGIATLLKTLWRRGKPDLNKNEL